MDSAPRRFTNSPVINVIAAAIDKASRTLIRNFGEVENLQVSQKGPGDFVTAADKKSEKILYEELSEVYPDDGFLMEESDEIFGRNNVRWIIDPLDGTHNFMHGIPHFAISIAREVNGEVDVGVVYDPIKDEFFWAEKGRGAFQRNRRLRVSSRSDMANSLFASEMPGFSRTHTPKAKAVFDKLIAQTGFRSFGSAALNLAYVAAGRLEGYIEYGLKPWDVAAGLLIVKEAGGYVGGVQLQDRPETGESVVATNEALSSQIINLARF